MAVLPPGDPGPRRPVRRPSLHLALRLILAAAVSLGACATAQSPDRREARSFVRGPVQGPVAEATPWTHGDFTITPLATYDIQAKVLSARTYSDDREAKAAPLDLALGWNQMADDQVLASYRVRQEDRWYYVRWSRSPLSRDDIIGSSANTHIVPATRQLEERLRHVAPGQIVRLKGYLVEVTAPDGWRWRSSLSRQDTGDGACEVLWVEDFEVVPNHDMVATG